MPIGAAAITEIFRLTFSANSSMKFSATHLLLAALLANAAEASLRAKIQRLLSLEKIAGYEPRTSVYDHNAISFDQEKLEELLNLKTDASFADAKRVYQEGSFSKSFAEVTITSAGGLPFDIAKGTSFSGTTVDGGKTSGGAIQAYKAGDTKIQIQYKTGDTQSGYSNCQVGGNPDPNTAGCFQASGNLILDGATDALTYTYDVATNNDNARTIQGFSTDADTRFRPDWPASTTPLPLFPDMQKFVNYYGTVNYADEYIQAAFSKTSTNFLNGNARFNDYGFDGRVEAIEKATAYMSIGLYAIRELEDAIVDCNRGCDTDECNDDAVQALDEAVAFYTGALEGEDGSGSGNLMYSLADKRCADFKTCGLNGDETSGTSKVNIEIFREFEDMKDNLSVENCKAAEKNKERIAELFFVPLIQGTLRYAYITNTETSPTEKADSEGAVFAAAVLPMVHDCNARDAEIIYENMRNGQNGSANFEKVKSAFERNYRCMNIKCSDVGGVYNTASLAYEPGARPCGDSSDVNVGLAVGLSIGGLALVAILAYFFKCRRRSSQVEFKTENGAV